MPRPGETDAYRRQARAEGFVSRAVYKLKAIDQKYRLFRRGQRVLDLGCTPGSWLQYIGNRVGPEGLVVGVDLETPRVSLVHPLYFIPGNVLSLDFSAIRSQSPYFHVVVSDLAPKTSGVKGVDQQRSLDLAWQALETAQELLVEGGHFLVKIFEGPDTGGLAAQMKKTFQQCHRIKPAGSRPASKEYYLLGLHRRTGPNQGEQGSKAGVSHK
jgi:23S rRNA (uridine2552-2'-O)-methyltransferase|uniref:Ribosomal RNA large subunit methyltransferase E n=1 Tax=Desulfobacca acetoxidans TaxID=60893 RepID=A0A7V6A1C4_9BACT